MSNPDYKIILKDIFIKACKMKADPAIKMSHAQQIDRQPVQYYFNRTEVKVNAISANSNDFIWDNVVMSCVRTKL